MLTIVSLTGVSFRWWTLPAGVGRRAGVVLVLVLLVMLVAT